MKKPVDRPSVLDCSAVSVLTAAVDYARGFIAGLAGFRYCGPAWFGVLCLYLVHPVIGRVFPGRVVRCGRIRVRLGDCDLSVLVNLFRDYDIRFLSRAVAAADLVIDAGANIGTFSFLVKQIRPDAKVIAIEPDPETYQFLTSQPFASDILCKLAAIGPRDGHGQLIRGPNSVTHSMEFGGEGRTDVISVASLVEGRTLLKLDIEGGELDVLDAGLPSGVEWLLMEWHYRVSPAERFPAGVLRRILTTIYGQTTWTWVRDGSRTRPV